MNDLRTMTYPLAMPYNKAQWLEPVQRAAFNHVWETNGVARFADHGHRKHPTDPDVVAELDHLKARTGLKCCNNPNQSKGVVAGG